MSVPHRLSTLLGAAILAGCAQTPPIDSMQPDALHVAQRRGAFELNCPQATAQVLSRETVQTPVIMNPRFAPPERDEYTIGVSGCGKRTTYLVVCAAGGNGCYAGGARQ